jgi:hypothetical protein
MKLTADQLAGLTKPFDVFLFYDNPEWWNVPLWVAVLGIQSYQRNYFGRSADVWPVHAELVLRRDKLLNAVPPRVCWDTIDQASKRRVKVFRPTFYNFTQADAEWMIGQIETETEYLNDDGKPYRARLIGQDYDIPQLFRIAINGMLGYTARAEAVPELDKGQANKVCSVITRVPFEHLRKHKALEAPAIGGVDPYKKLFGGMNVKKFFEREARWAHAVVEAWQKNRRHDIELTTPADYACSDYYDNEFVEVTRNF